METIILVHSAWADASSWDAVVPLLKAKGHEVIARTIAMSRIPGKVILVGHSLGGMIISSVAERAPRQSF